MAPTKSKKAITSARSGGSRNVFRFLDLPPEIRNKIHFDILKAENPIRMYYYSRPIPSEQIIRSKDPRRSYEYKGTTTVTVRNGRPRIFAVAKVHNLAMLRVSKATAKEATAIFYGSNRFIFQSPSALREFKYDNKEGFTLLKDVEVRCSFGDSELYLRGLKANRIVLHGMSFARSLWRVIQDFLRNHVEWKRSEHRGGILTNIKIKSLAEQRQRFNTLFFSVPRSCVGVYKSGAVSRFRNTQHAHEVLKEEVLEEWHNDIQRRKQEKASKEWAAHTNEEALREPALEPDWKPEWEVEWEPDWD